MSRLKTVLVLCTGNSCRSQMGEAILNHDLAGLVRRIHLPFHDPHGEPLESFIAVRDDIRTRLVPLVREALGL